MGKVDVIASSAPVLAHATASVSAAASALMFAPVGYRKHVKCAIPQMVRTEVTALWLQSGTSNNNVAKT